MRVSAVMFENADSPSVVTPLGIVSLATPDTPWNAPLPMLVTLLGMVMLVKPAAFWNA